MEKNMFQKLDFLFYQFKLLNYFLDLGVVGKY